VLTKMMKYVAICALMLSVAFRNYAASYERAVGFVVAMGAVLVAVQATRAKKYGWAVTFYALAVVFNPFVLTGAFSGNVALCVVAGAIGLFVYSLYTLKTQPRLSVMSITDRTPGSQSL
jgi:hypothetical protein